MFKPTTNVYRTSYFSEEEAEALSNSEKKAKNSETKESDANESSGN